MSAGLILFLCLFVAVFLVIYRDFEVEENWTALLPALSAAVFFFLGSWVYLSPVAGIITGVFGYKLCKSVMRWREERWAALVRKQARDFVTAAAGMYASGKNDRSVIEDAAKNLPDPLGGMLDDVLSSYDFKGTAFPDSFRAMAEETGVDEFRAVASILEFGKQGGPKATGRGLLRLGNALRRRDKLLTERAKAVAESSAVAWVVIGILFTVSIIDAVKFRAYFASSLVGKLDLAVGVGIVVGLFFLAQKLAQDKDLMRLGGGQ
ncbi:hypothetical protein GFC01_06125 [Desulfofundulus thermobenzoicus]|uniref:Type II secretion system protein GspF domain-containing protein n=1 Tax=Desulfofundulus thermobenzoicus TaxID=29376 RepID=A0A6N7IQN7_9FIRM|nr:hypothetical protein [Desulfofundulus thermobenzoicus]MQL51847.1 hypothetical protein [Desulfofundulus thermobenzoicus]